MRTRLMYNAACKVEFQPFTVVLTADVFQLFDSTQQTQQTIHGVWSSTAGTYVSRPVKYT